MHKSWGNAIEFDEAADRMGVDVMRWMFAKARPEDNILFGWHAADEARRELLVLWNVYAFFVTYARLAEWTPDVGVAAGRRAAGPGPLDPVARGRHGGRRRGAASRRPTPSGRRAPSRRTWITSPPGTCACRASGCAATRTRPTGTAPSPRSTRRSWRRPGCWRPILPFLADTLYDNLVDGRRRGGARQRPPHALADGRPGRAPRRGARGPHARRPARGRPRAHAPQRERHPDPTAAGPGLARDPGRRAARSTTSCSAPGRRRDQRQGRRADRRRLRPGRPAGQGRSCPKVGKRLGSAIPAVMAAARDG